MRTRPERLGMILTLILSAALSGGAVRATAATPLPSWSRPSTAVKLSQLPAGLAQAVERALGPAKGNDDDQFAQQQELQASDGAPFDEFGFSVALNNGGHIALIGVPGKNSGKGAAYVFTEQGHTWTEQQELQASDGAPFDGFGWSVALNNDGHIALIGVPGKNSFQGAAYVFTAQGNTWTEQQELQASDGAPGDGFGWSVALNNDGRIALTGAYSKNSSQGAAYVFTAQGNTWTEQQELQASDGAPNEFGFSVALNNAGHIALIGVPGRNSFQGAAYVFTEQGHTWTEQQELQAPDGAPFDWFGHSVALNGAGHIALIGAPFRNSSQGAAYVFTEQGHTWTEQQELQASDGAPNDDFGLSVALNGAGHIALIGAPFKNSSQGAAYVFTEQGHTWTEQQELQASDGAPNDGFGWSVALNNDGHIALIGAPFKNSSQGAAYVFTQ